MTDEFILKLAASVTYSPSLASARNYIPKKSGIKFGVVKLRGADVHDNVDVSFDKTDVPKKSTNTTKSPDLVDSFYRFTNTFRNDISGTGYGRQYWTSDNARNAYNNI